MIWNEVLMKKVISPTRSLALAAVLLVVAACSPLRAEVEVKQSGNDVISVAIDGQPFTDFYIGSKYPKPFLAPLRTASGLIVTRKYPMENVDGETRDHQHHRGLWIGYGEINGVNFWENEFKYVSGQPKNYDPGKIGKVVLRKVNEAKSSSKSGKVDATFEWLGANDSDFMEEHRVMTFSGTTDTRVIDVDATFTAKQAVHFADTKEGFFAIRLADSMTGKNGGLMTNSEGAQTEKSVWGKRANWVDYDGTVDGQKVGIVIFDHPKNFNHPTRWHSRDYGLFAANPFGLKDFDPKATEEGGHSMASGDTLRFRYRVIIHPGDMPKKNIEKLYAEYAK
jgi:hypothetical protein